MANNKPLSKREIKKAARLFTLMTIGQFDCGGTETDEEENVLGAAVEAANDALNKEYPKIKGYLGSINDCIDYIKGMRK